MQERLNADVPRPLDPDSLAYRISLARTKRGLSQGRLAELVGLKQPDISKLETGRMLKTTAMASLVRVLNVPGLWLERGEGPEPVWDAQSAPTPMAPRTGGEPPKPDFAAREWTESDWSLLQDIKDAIQTSPARAELVAQWREEAARARAHYMALAEADFRKRVQAVQDAGGGRAGGMSIFGDDLGSAPASAPSRREGGKQ